MSKIYKLLIKYPSLPKNWEVGMKVGQGDRTATFADYSPCSSKYTDVRISCFEIEENSEFWEEIKEYDFEIVKFRNRTTGTIFSRYIDIPTFIFGYENCEIYSVKRKSDGEVFCIGDKCEPKDCKNPGTIEKFEFVLGNQLRIQGRNEKGRSWYLSINTIEKLRTPLFTTLDGKDIYEGDSYYTVFFKETKDFDDPPRWKALGKFSAEKLTGDDKWTNECKYFSSIEVAEKYIEENKPQFSKKQVINILKGFDRDVNCFDERFDYNLYIEKYKDEE